MIEKRKFLKSGLRMKEGNNEKCCLLNEFMRKIYGLNYFLIGLCFIVINQNEVFGRKSLIIFVNADVGMLLNYIVFCLFHAKYLYVHCFSDYLKMTETFNKTVADVQAAFDGLPGWAKVCLIFLQYIRVTVDRRRWWRRRRDSALRARQMDDSHTTDHQGLREGEGLLVPVSPGAGDSEYFAVLSQVGDVDAYCWRGI